MALRLDAVTYVRKVTIDRFQVLLFDYCRSNDLPLIVDCFFQAEDGIRDIGVTGVQTCALPISLPFWSSTTATTAGSPGPPAPSWSSAGRRRGSSPPRDSGIAGCSATESCTRRSSASDRKSVV